MSKQLILLIFILFTCSEIFSQDIVYTGHFRYLGDDQDDPVFWLHDEGNEKIDHNSLYKLIKGNEGFLGFYYWKEPNIPADEIVFIHDNIYIRGKGKERDSYILSVYVDDEEIYSVSGKFEEDIIYSESKNTLIIFISDEKNYYTVVLNLDTPQVQSQFVPIKGYRGYVIDDWLYFAYYHENYEYSPYPDDIFRVRIGDWLNPKLIFTSDEYDDWFLYPENHIIVTDIALDFLEKEQSRKSQILYNIEKEAYAVVPRISTHNRSSTPDYLKFNNKYYGFFSKKILTHGIETIHLEALPELPNSYPYKEHDVLPREVWYNIPLSKKTFDGTFITPYLLREASKTELDKLQKPQLRLLRNAIYAQQGYLFNSNDLQEFFIKFEWYRMMTAKKKDNKDVILLPEDKERAELIRSVEVNK